MVSFPMYGFFAEQSCKTPSLAACAHALVPSAPLSKSMAFLPELESKALDVIASHAGCVLEEWFVLAEPLKDKNKLPTAAAALNKRMVLRSFMSGFEPSLADVLIWHTLKSNPRWTALAKSPRLQPHLCRWFKHIDELESLRLVWEEAKAFGTAEDTSTGSFDIGVSETDVGKVVTRFPPEPSGFLHIGHAKAALLNDYIAKRYKGKMILRFDDTNPSKEKDDYVQSIIEDLAALGIEYVQPISHTSNFFDQLEKYCVQMIEHGDAFVDDTDVQTVPELVSF